MQTRWINCGLFFALLACDGDGGGSERKPSPPPADIMAPAGWQIGPVIKRQEGYVNYSNGVASKPGSHPEGWQFKFPVAGGNVNYVTVPTGSLAGKQGIRMQFRIEGDPDVKLRGKGCGDSPTAITVYLQRKGDDWSGRGEYETYRWWASFASLGAPQLGEHEIYAPFAGRWTAIQTSNSEDAPDKFKTALTNAGRIGFTFANCEGYGHGAFATGPARFVMTSFRVE